MCETQKPRKQIPQTKARTSALAIDVCVLEYIGRGWVASLWHISTDKTIR